MFAGFAACLTGRWPSIHPLSLNVIMVPCLLRKAKSIRLINKRSKAWKIEKRAVGLEISESECQQIQQFSERLSKLTLQEIFTPVTCNPVYFAAKQSDCHPSSPAPVAVLKAAEVAMKMALPRDASIRFEPCQEEVV